MSQDSPEIAIVLSGIGGQGVQLLAKVLARAALAEGLHAMLASEYGGEMRGGRSCATVVLGMQPIRALPVVEKATCAIALHHLHWSAVEKLLIPNAFVLSDAELQTELHAAFADPQCLRHIVMPAKQTALQAGNVMAAGFALLGGFCALTGVVRLDGLCAAMTASLPPYRRQHIATNEQALRAGAAAVPALAAALELNPRHRLAS